MVVDEQDPGGHAYSLAASADDVVGGELQADDGAATFARGDLERSFDAGGTLVHALKAPVPVLGPGVANAVVLHLQQERGAVGHERDPEIVGACVLPHVADGLLGDSEQLGLGSRGKGGPRLVEDQVDAEVHVLGDLVDVVSERARQPVVGHVVPEVQDRVADLGDDSADLLTELVRKRDVSRLVRHRRDLVDDVAQGHELLGDAVVHLASDPLPLLGCRQSTDLVEEDCCVQPEGELVGDLLRDGSRLGRPAVRRRSTTLPSWCPAPRRPITSTSSLCSWLAPRRGWRARSCHRDRRAGPGAGPKRGRTPQLPCTRAVSQSSDELRGQLDAVEADLAATGQVVQLAHQLVGCDVGRLPLLEVADAAGLDARQHPDTEPGDQPEARGLERGRRRTARSSSPPTSTSATADTRNALRRRQPPVPDPCHQRRNREVEEDRTRPAAG